MALLLHNEAGDGLQITGLSSCKISQMYTIHESIVSIKGSMPMSVVIRTIKIVFIQYTNLFSHLSK